jgi:hypothetical protein
MVKREPTRVELFERIKQLRLWKLLMQVWPLKLTPEEREQRFDLAAKLTEGWIMVPEAEAAIAALRHVREGTGHGWGIPKLETLAAAIAAHEALPAAMRERLEGGGDALQAGLFYADLTAALSAVVDCVWNNCGADEPIRQAFMIWHQEDCAYADLAEMRAAFLALPEHEQQRILNGWKPVKEWPPEQDVIRDTAEADMTVRVLLMTGNGNGEGTSSQCIIKRQSWGAAEVTIREGATKGEAVAAVRAMLERLEMQWDELVGGPLDVLIHPEKEPRTPNLVALLLGGGKSEEAKAVAAA